MLKSALSTGMVVVILWCGVLVAQATSREEIVRIHAKAARGDAGAQKYLGKIYGNGQFEELGFPEDKLKSTYWWCKYFENCMPTSPWTGGVNSNIKHYSKIFFVGRDYLFELANKGDPSAQFVLGMCYKVGIELASTYYLKPDLNKAVYWLSKSAEQGHVLAQFFLGWFFTGEMSEMSDTERFLAIEHGYTPEGYLRKDEQKASYWMRKAAEQGFAPAQYMFASFGSKEGYEYWMSKAAEQGLREAQNAMSTWCACHGDEYGALYWKRKRDPVWLQKLWDILLKPSLGNDVNF